jgi:hypothetical protein
MNAYPIGKEIKNPKVEGRQLIDPRGQRIEPEQEIEVKKGLELHGMGQYKRRI